MLEKNWERISVAAMVTLSVAACGDDERSEVVRRVIGPEGGTVSSADGVLTIALRPGALAEDTEISIAGEDSGAFESDGQAPPRLFGPAYRVRPDIDLEINASITYQHPLPDDPSGATIAVVLREDFDAGRGQWQPLTRTRLETEAELVGATDGRLSMYYGLAAEGGMSGGTDTSADDGGTGGTMGGTGGDDMTAGDDEAGTGTTTGDSTTGDADDGSTSMGDESTGSTGDPTTGGMPVECDSLFMGPYEIETRANVFQNGSEDFAMTGNGTFVARNGGEFLETDGIGDGTQFFAPINFPAFGVRFDVDGNLVVANDDPAVRTVQRLVNGAFENIIPADMIGRPNGIYPDRSGRIWVTDFGSNSLVRIDANDSFETVLTGQAGANGILYDETRDILYWSLYGDSQVWSAPVDEAGNLGTPTMVVDLAGNSDGMAMDACGHLYVVDQAGFMNNPPCRLDRVFLDDAGSLDTTQGTDGVEEIAGGGELGVNCSNAMFGYGFGGDDDRSLFVVGGPGSVYRIFLDVPGAPIANVP